MTALTAYAYALVAGLGLAYFITGIPVQLADCLANIYSVQPRSFGAILTDGGGGYLRPLLWAQFKLAYEWAGGAYTATFKGIQVVQVLLCATLFVAALRVRRRADLLVVPVGLAMLFGAHTFDGTVREAFPVNVFLSVVIACLAAVVLASGRHAWWRDVVAVVLFGVMLFTVESGVLVWVCLAAAWLAGARGVSGRAVVAGTAVLGAYFVLRFLVLDVGTPDLLERSSGFGLRVLEAGELKARFGESPYAFYAYNVASQMLTVLASEPRAGTWVFVRSALNGELQPAQIIAVASSVGATLIIGWYAVARMPEWRARRFTHGDRIVLVFAAVLIANAALSFPYTKDVIVSPAGAFHALAAAVAVRHLLERLSTARVPATVAVSLLLCLFSAAWTVRFVGMHYVLRDYSFVVRNEWTDIDAWARRNAVAFDTPERVELMQRLRADAIARRAPAPQFAQPRAARYFK